MVANQIYALWKLRNQVGAGKNWSRASGKIMHSTFSQLVFGPMFVIAGAIMFWAFWEMKV